MFDKRPPSIDTVRSVLVDGPVKLRFAEDTKPWLLDSFTAGAMVAVYNALNADNQGKIDTLLRTKRGFMKFAAFSFKHVS